MKTRGNPTYRTWAAMKGRCLNSALPRFQLYGGRGITVCDAWMEYENFLADMGTRPPGLSLDRIDCNGNYEPGNCRWANQQLQIRNSRARKTKNRTSKYKGVGWYINTTGKNWRTRISIESGTLVVGYFETEHEAAVAYNTAILQRFGHDVFLNDI